MTAIRDFRRGFLGSLSVATLALAMPGALAQEGEDAKTGATQSPPTTTLPFEPTVPSAPPGYSPSETDRSPSPSPSPAPRSRSPSPSPPPPPPGDALCYEIGPYIRAGVISSRFASLSTATAQGGVLGRFEAGDALKEAGGQFCTVAIPGAALSTVDAPYNQVTCPIDAEQSDTIGLASLEQSRDQMTERLAACPAMSEWSPTVVTAGEPREGTYTADQVFSHPDVAVEVLVRARQHRKMGQWPDTYLRTLSIILRTTNPDRPAPPPDEVGGREDMAG